MLNWFFNWLDPKILKMEKWVNQKVVEPDKIDIDLDKVKKDTTQATSAMFYKSQPTKDIEETLGPFIANLEGAQLLALMYGPGEIEAFALLKFKEELWWRHRDAGTTHDFKAMAFDDMQEFAEFIGVDNGFWECVLRSEAKMADMSVNLQRPLLKIPDVKAFVQDFHE